MVCALLGENGAGKTTTIRLLLGLTTPDEGKLTVLGLDSASRGQAVRGRVGYVPERPTLYEWMTVSEIGWFTSGFYGSGFLARYLNWPRNINCRWRKIKSLSKGMRTRCRWHWRWLHEPELLILDEPTSGLDTLVRREFLEGMVNIAAAGRTVLLSSHQISEVEHVADMVAILSGGKLLAFERLDDLKDQIRELSIALVEQQRAAAGDRRAQSCRQRRHHNQFQILVRGAARVRWRHCGPTHGCASWACDTPSLEEIFVAHLELADPSKSPAAAGEVVVR